MLAHLTQASRRPATQATTAARTCISLVPRRHYAQNAEAVADPFKAGPTYAQWLRSEGIKYKEAHRPNNWLGGEVVEFVLSGCSFGAGFLTCAPCAYTALPAEPIVQTADSNFRLHPHCYLERLHCRPRYVQRARHCSAAWAEHRAGGCDPAVEGPRGALAKGSCLVTCSPLWRCMRRVGG